MIHMLVNDKCASLKELQYAFRFITTALPYVQSQWETRPQSDSRFITTITNQRCNCSFLYILAGVIDGCGLCLVMIFILYTVKQLKHGSFVYYWIYPYSLVVSSWKIAHEGWRSSVLLSHQKYHMRLKALLFLATRLQGRMDKSNNTLGTVLWYTRCVCMLNGLNIYFVHCWHLLDAGNPSCLQMTMASFSPHPDTSISPHILL